MVQARAVRVLLMSWTYWLAVVAPANAQKTDVVELVNGDRWQIAGVRADATQGDAALPLLVRLIAARNIAMGAALLVSPPPQARRTSEVTLLLTGLDAAAVLVSRRTGDVAGRSALLSLLVLATTLVGVVQWHRRP